MRFTFNVSLFGPTGITTEEKHKDRHLLHWINNPKKLANSINLAVLRNVGLLNT